ncbi:MAG: carboxypeptidase-like regulatory domain-containing protein, partial [Gemmatimonadota bacterium]
MRKLGLLTTLLVLSFTTTGFAQQLQRTITGQVTDDVTGEAISFPQITVGGTAATGRARTTTGTGTVGGEDGRFTLQVPPGQVVLTVQRIGYRSANVTVPADLAVVDVALTVDYLNVEEVVVTGRA